MPSDLGYWGLTRVWCLFLLLTPGVVGFLRHQPVVKMASTLQETAESLIRWDPNPRTRAAVAEALKEAKENGAWEALQDIVGEGRLAFGTAGLRGPFGTGNARMNDLTVIQTTQGLARVLETDFGDDGKQRGVAIGYDHRADPTFNVSSETFALAAAAVLMSQGFRVYLYRGLVATPLVPFAIERHKCVAGIMVTASHNPKQDDGYKLYWADGVQIVSPIDKRVAASILACLEPWHAYAYDSSTVRENPLCVDATDETVAAYVATVAAKLCRYRADNERASELLGPIVYTPMHGVGDAFATRVFHAFGLPPYQVVASQRDPDPSFPTVRFPNPEEKGALDLACRFAESLGARLVLANDPDADRMAVAEYQVDSKTWHVFSGDQIGSLLGCWEWEQAVSSSRATSGGVLRAAAVASTVSSKMLRAVAETEGFEFHDTLTGFKYLGHKARELAEQGVRVLLSYEEAIGFCLGDTVFDKDGVSAAAVMAEHAVQLAKQGKTLKQRLEDLYLKYGYFLNNNGYYIVKDPQVTANIFTRLRNGGAYWEEAAGYKISAIRDLTTPGYDSSTPDKRPVLPVSSGTQMITYEFADGLVLTLRTSGTEPKLKFYSELRGKPGEPKASVQARLDDMMGKLLKELLQPDVHGISSR